ncbi:MAG: MBOAT family protein [bacterium]|nr:MBOAT family protein [bacterium]
MLFNSIEFLIFFPVVTILYFLFPHKYRWGLLLISSCVFYIAYVPVYIYVLFLSVLLNYFAGKYIENFDSVRKKRILLISIIANVLILVVFKYFNFFRDSYITKLLSLSHLSILLPLGLSFYTFSNISYIIEVYRGNIKAEKHLGIFAAFVMFYPKVTQGPIERAANLLPQFHKEHFFDYKRVTDGLKLMMWGLFKKLVIADRLAISVNHIYNNPTAYSGVPFIIATIFFAFQIYADFSGYTDIAIGVAEIMGFKLSQNFNRPYSSKSIKEFWRRWHISLSSWLMRYIYLPIAYSTSRIFKKERYFNIKADKWVYLIATSITFLICGIWHGIGQNFIIWGGLFGFYLICSEWTRGTRKRIEKLIRVKKYPAIYNFIRVIITFGLVSFAWIFFRADNISNAIYIIKHLFCFNLSGLSSINGKKEAILAIVFMEFVYFIQGRYGSIRHILSEKPLWIRWTIYYMLILSIIFLGVFNRSKFIYFKF